MARRLGSELFVSRLSFYTTTEELKRWFSRFGVVTEARLIKDRRTQRPKGFGFVTFDSEVEAQNALKAMNGRRATISEYYWQNCISLSLMFACAQIMGGRLIFVEVANAKPKEDETWTSCK